MRAPRRRLITALACVAAAGGRAMEGVPPLEWFASGPVLPEGQASVAVAADVGSGAAFVGGDAARQLAVKRWVVAPVDVRYGLFPGLEARGVFPFNAGTSDQAYVNYATGGAPEARTATLSGNDFGDPEVALRWQAWEDGDGRSAVDLLGGVGLPLGTYAWGYNQDNFITGPATPDLAISDGAWKVLLGVDGRTEAGATRVDGFLGWILKFPVEATAIEPGLSTIEVREPMPLVGRARIDWAVAEGWRAGVRADGFWAPAGTIVPGGLLAKFPGSLPTILDSYGNLVHASAGAWAGVGVAREVADVAEARVEALAPVAEGRLYRSFRVDVSLRYAWKP